MSEIVVRTALGLSTHPGCACGGACNECAPARAAAAVVAPIEFDRAFPVPEHPPADWFDEPAWLGDEERLQITDDGRVGFYFYERGVCQVTPTYPDECWMPQPSPTGYALFHQAEAVTADGGLVRVGAVGSNGGHASPFVPVTTAQRHYADPSAQLMVCRLGDNERGGWGAGALIPGITYGDVALIRRSAMSGDWRPMEDRWFEANDVPRAAAAAAGYYDCLGPTLVTRPGLPNVRAFLLARRAASAGEPRPVYLGGTGGVQLDARTAAAVSAADQGGSMGVVTVTLPNGVEVDVPEGAMILNRDGALVVSGAGEVHTAAPPAAGEEQPPPPAGDGNLEERVRALEVGLDEIRDFIEQARTASAAEVDGKLANLDGQAVALPA